MKPTGNSPQTPESVAMDGFVMKNPTSLSESTAAMDEMPASVINTTSLEREEHSWESLRPCRRGGARKKLSSDTTTDEQARPARTHNLS